MERLTKQDKFHYPYSIGRHLMVETSQLPPFSILRGEVVNRLWEYEETGLEPQEIKNLQAYCKASQDAPEYYPMEDQFTDCLTFLGEEDFDDPWELNAGSLEELKARLEDDFEWGNDPYFDQPIPMHKETKTLIRPKPKHSEP